jgi:hypothetical protein
LVGTEKGAWTGVDRKSERGEGGEKVTWNNINLGYIINEADIFLQTEWLSILYST